MQAGLASKQLTFRDIFTSTPNFLSFVRFNCIFIRQVISTAWEDCVISMAA